jgi:hypothetical protein
MAVHAGIILDRTAADPMGARGAVAHLHGRKKVPQKRRFISRKSPPSRIVVLRFCIDSSITHEPIDATRDW